MTEPRELTFTTTEVTEALQGMLAPETVVNLLRGYDEKRRTEKSEIDRFQRMANVIHAYDEIVLLEQEGGTVPSKNRIIKAAADYLGYIANSEILDLTDEKMRKVAASIIGTQDLDMKSVNAIIEIKQELEAQGFVFGNNNQGEDIDVSTD